MNDEVGGILEYQRFYDEYRQRDFSERSLNSVEVDEKAEILDDLVDGKINLATATRRFMALEAAVADAEEDEDDEEDDDEEEEE